MTPHQGSGHKQGKTYYKYVKKTCDVVLNISYLLKLFFYAKNLIFKDI